MFKEKKFMINTKKIALSCIMVSCVMSQYSTVQAGKFKGDWEYNQEQNRTRGNHIARQDRNAARSQFDFSSDLRFDTTTAQLMGVLLLSTMILPQVEAHPIAKTVGKAVLRTAVGVGVKAGAAQVGDAVRHGTAHCTGKTQGQRLNEAANQDMKLQSTGSHRGPTRPPQ